jgi:hypothetical protein
MRMNALQEEYSDVELQYQLAAIERLTKVTNAQNNQRINALDEEMVIQEKKNQLSNLKADVRHKIFKTRQTPVADSESTFSSMKSKTDSANVKPNDTMQSQEDTRVEVKGDRFVDPRQYATA